MSTNNAGTAGNSDDTLEFNLLVKVNGDFGISVNKTLCEDCAELISHRVLQMSDNPCDECGKKVWPDK
jgi:hypothetical protein